MKGQTEGPTGDWKLLAKKKVIFPHWKQEISYSW